MSLYAVFIGFISIIVPGFFLSLALLKKTKLNIIEIAIIGFIFGMIFPPGMTWIEGYFINSIHFLAFSANLYQINVVILTIVGIILSAWQGAFGTDFLAKLNFSGTNGSRKHVTAAAEKHYELDSKITSLKIDEQLMLRHKAEEDEMQKRHSGELAMLKQKGAGSEELEKVRESHAEQERNLHREHEREESRVLAEKPKPQSTQIMHYLAWGLLLVLMLVAFSSRVSNISTAPRYFEFDPYFDMMSTAQILTYGYQLKLDHSAWPVYLNGSLIQQGSNAANGTIHRIQPLMPYLEAYWYEIANSPPPPGISQASTSGAVNTNLLSTVSSVYPPITAALLVFVVFMFLYHEYGDFPAIIGAAFATIMPTLITTFIAGEQLVEPWGIFALFFMVASYALAAQNPKEKRYAILAGIAFASNFLGAHYYNVTAAVLAFYILVQSIIDAATDRNSMDFYKMNALMLFVIILFYAVYAPYNATLTNRIPTILGIPTIVSFPLLALIVGVLAGILTDTLSFSSIPKNAKEILHKPLNLFGKNNRTVGRVFVIIALIIIAIVAILVTPIGKPIHDYISLAEHFTTPSTPLFMTVQEYLVTGPAFNFGSAGFGIIGASIGGFPLIIWIMLILFMIMTAYEIFLKGSRSAIFTLVMVLVLSAAGMSEVKYLPHFGVAYIIAIGVVIGELYMIVKSLSRDTVKNSTTLYTIGAGAIIIESTLLILSSGMLIGLAIIAVGIIISVIYSYLATNSSPTEANLSMYSTGMSALILGILVIISGASPLITTFTAHNMSCSNISKDNMVVADTMYCNQLTSQWLTATEWMRANIGPFAPRILSWWDYGDWINWFGNSNAVIRGDNAVATLDYAVAAHYVLGSSDGYNSTALGKFMDSTQAKYVLFDDQLVPKWSALDFLACVYANQTSKAYAISQGKPYGQSFLLGTSPCELSHDPAVIAIPAQPSINEYCQLPNKVTAISAISLVGMTVPSQLNQSFCVSPTQNANGVLNVYYANGTKANVVISSYYYLGTIAGPSSQTYLEFLEIYLPNGPNDTITNAPTAFYNSTYYKGFFLGRLNGFTLVYPKNFTGINMVNSTNTVMILEENNYTGGMPYVTPKPSWIKNNYTIPG